MRMNNKRTQILARRRRREGGSTLVESSLVLVTAAILMIGLMNVSILLFLQSSVVERMRAAARYGVINYDPVKIENTVLYGTTTPDAEAQPSFNLTPEMVSVTRLDNNTAADRVRIAVTGYPLVSYVPYFSGRIKMQEFFLVQPMETGNLPGN